MPDLFDPLKGAPDPLVRPPLSAEEVRLRGDRMRRRRRVLAGAGAGVVAALVVGVSATFAGNPAAGPTAAPPGTEAPSHPPGPGKTPVSPTAATSDPVTWRTDIPDGFPLDRGWPELRFDEQQQVGPKPEVAALPTLTACERALPVSSNAVDRLGARYSEPEDVRLRQLYTYPDAASAQAWLTGAADLFRRCPEQAYDTTVTVAEVREVPVGAEGYVVVRTSSNDGLPTTGLEVTQLVRVGNALLLSVVSNEGGAGPEGPESQVQEQRAEVAALVEEMCAFAPDGC